MIQKGQTNEKIIADLTAGLFAAQFIAAQTMPVKKDGKVGSAINWKFPMNALALVAATALSALLAVQQEASEATAAIERAKHKPPSGSKLTVVPK